MYPYNLKHYTQNQHNLNDCFAEDRLLKILQNVVDVLKYIHKHGIAHLDIKLENVLLEAEYGEITDVVLGGWGQCRQLVDMTKNPPLNLASPLEGRNISPEGRG